MTVKLRQNSTKMREFNQTRDQKEKTMVKIFIVYKKRLCFQMGILAVFSAKVFSTFSAETNSIVYFHTKQSKQSTYTGSWYTSQNMAAFDLCKRTLHFMRIIRVFFWLTLNLPFVVYSGKCPTPSCLTSSCWCLRSSNLRSSCCG